MSDKTNENADLAMVDCQIEDLCLRLYDLKERMTTMALENYEVKNHSILLFTMQEVMKDPRQLRSEMLAVLGGNNNFSKALSQGRQSGQTMGPRSGVGVGMVAL